MIKTFAKIYKKLLPEDKAIIDESLKILRREMEVRLRKTTAERKALKQANK